MIHTNTVWLTFTSFPVTKPLTLSSIQFDLVLHSIMSQAEKVILETALYLTTLRYQCPLLCTTFVFVNVTKPLIQIFRMFNPLILFFAPKEAPSFTFNAVRFAKHYAAGMKGNFMKTSLPHKTTLSAFYASYSILHLHVVFHRRKLN